MMGRSDSFRYRQSQLYGWPFYIARKTLRRGGRWMLRAADALSQREKYPFPIFRPLLPANARLKGLHAGRRCFILGNGPSLKTQDVTPLSGELTFAMNGFLHHPRIEQCQPTYYCLTDPIYFDGSAASSDFLDRLLRVVPSSHLIVPYSAAQTLALRGIEPDRVTFVTYSGDLASTRLPWIDLTRTIPAVQNCAQLAILVALYAGCSPIYLLGMDHDWLAHRGTDGHFYSGKTLENHPAVHGELARYSYRAILEDVLKVWQGYEILDTYSRARGQQIINCTNGGFLDVFERGALKDVLALRRAA
ncbi:MAG TPA: hypothetical protein VN541_11405 [Tepidisphaeraceae bacterium]|nr:hypothetical protein [Tepidisphaeraceae bacterium]